MVIDVNQVNNTFGAEGSDQSGKTDVTNELKKIAEARQTQKQTDNKHYSKTLNEAKNLDSLQGEKVAHKAQKDPGIKILSSLAEDLAKMGVADISSKTATKSMKGNIEKEIDKMLEKRGQDRAELSDKVTKDAVQRGQKRSDEQKNESNEKQFTQKMENADVKDALKDYSGAYANFALSANPEAKEKLEDASERLRRKGFSEKEIIALEKSVKRGFRNQFTSDIQSSFINHMFSSKNTFDFIVTGKKLNQSFKQAIDSPNLSGVSDDKQSVQDKARDVAEMSRDEIREFVRDAVESKLMEKHISGRDTREDLKKLVSLGNSVGFNFESFLKTWEQKKFDLGLFIIEINHLEGAKPDAQMAIGDVSAGGVGSRPGYDLSKDEEKELFINQLRAEFMKKALTGDPFSVISFAPKIRKLKNGLIQLGLIPEDFSRIEKEAKALARYRTLEMLNEAFIERSTYYELSGPAYSLLSNKIRGLVSNLDKLDMKLGNEELNMLRDDANRRMHDHTIIELKSAMALVESNNDPALEQKIPFMIKLIKRIREESGFSHGMGEDDIEDIIAKAEKGNKSIKEGV